MLSVWELPLTPGGSWVLNRREPDLFETKALLTKKLEDGNNFKMTGFEGLSLLRRDDSEMKRMN